ncbi:unnamed protein product [Urochloa humidicola]
MLGPGPLAPALVAAAGGEEWCAWMGHAQARPRKEYCGPPLIRRWGGRSSPSRRRYFAPEVMALERGSESVCAGAVDENEEVRHPRLSAMECLEDLGGDRHHQMVILPRLMEELYEL